MSPNPLIFCTWGFSAMKNTMEILFFNNKKKIEFLKKFEFLGYFSILEGNPLIFYKNFLKFFNQSINNEKFVICAKKLW
jgi:hypothetical protein